MAVTSIWAVSSRVKDVLKYIENPDKTTEKPELSAEAVAARKAVGDVINYAENADKTERMMYVTGINCSAKNAADDFYQTKLSWGKTGGRLAYHGYQAFKEGDGQITAKQAHEIGIKLAKELWGDRFEVVVATHLNTGHYHNHFVVNSVSFVDGLKYRRTLYDYRQMQMISDRLCKEANLHVVESPSTTRGKTYDEWLAERQGKTTVRGLIRADIDYAIKLSRTEKQFANAMKEMGYEFKFFRKDGSYLDHPGIKPPGAKSYFRFRGLGPNYDFDSIKRRIIENTLVPGTPLLIEKKNSTRIDTGPLTELKGLPGIYQRYCIRLYAFVSKPAKKEYIPMALREDIVKLDRYIEQLDYLYQNRIESNTSLEERKISLKHEIGELKVQRRKLYSAKKRAIRTNDNQLLIASKAEIRDTSAKIRQLEKELSLCDSVSESSERILKNAELPTQKPEKEAISSQNQFKRFRP